VTDRLHHRRLALLTLFVLAAHLWLLGGWQRIVTPARPAPFIARTVTPPAATPAAPVERPVERVAAAPATKSPAALAPAPTAPRKQALAPESQRAPAPAAPSASGLPERRDQAEAAAPAPPPATQVAGAARATKFAVTPSARFHYDVIAQAKGMTLHGTAVLEWHNANGEYQAEMSMSSPVPFVRPRTQRSSGRVTAEGLAPLRFSDKVRTEEAAHFDRDNGRVVFSTNKPQAALEPGAQDRLSIVMQLGAMLAGEPAKYRPGTTITVQTASTKEAEPWTFTVEDTEWLELPGGRVSAVRLARNPRKEYDVKVELWLAPGAAYAPVRLRLTQPNGDWVDQQWSSTDRG
jgi:hypothetical protein